jgi:hypothetical protein
VRFMVIVPFLEAHHPSRPSFLPFSDGPLEVSLALCPLGTREAHSSPGTILTASTRPNPFRKRNSHGCLLKFFHHLELRKMKEGYID